MAFSFAESPVPIKISTAPSSCLLYLPHLPITKKGQQIKYEGSTLPIIPRIKF